MKAFVVALLLFGACYAPALAITEFCPARVAQMHDPAATVDADWFPAKDVEAKTASSTLTYTLDAETPRTIVHATMIADTDDGWYGWHVENVAVPKTTVTIKKWPLFGTATFARSGPLTVTFPKALVVHHAWVTEARADAETTIGWDALGDFACEVPDFPDGGPGFTPIVRRQAATAPATAPPVDAPSGTAVVVSQPFPIDCDRPFKRAIVARPVSPEYPRSAYDGGRYVSLIEVAVGDDGRLIDAWTYGSAGNFSFDLAAMRAARASRYASAISYCQPVRGYYIFRADFEPD